MKYKITVFSSKLYKEVVVEDDFKGLLIGTGKNCQVQLLREEFEQEFTIALKNNNGRKKWIPLKFVSAILIFLRTHKM